VEENSQLNSLCLRLNNKKEKYELVIIKLPEILL
jgi:hypothetical protein